MNHTFQKQHPPLLFLLALFCLRGLLGPWGEAQALAEGTGYSRVSMKDGRMSVSAKDAPLEALCKDIESKSGVRFRIQDALLEYKLSVEIKDLTLLKCLKRLLAHVNYMFCFDNRNRLSEVLIVGRSEPYTSPVLRKPSLRLDVPRVRRSFNRPRS
jgi:type II secretory pathway component GspD/PulD (secretin)